MLLYNMIVKYVLAEEQLASGITGSVSQTIVLGMASPLPLEQRILVTVKAKSYLN